MDSMVHHDINIFEKKNKNNLFVCTRFIYMKNTWDCVLILSTKAFLYNFLSSFVDFTILEWENTKRLKHKFFFINLIG
jgi:hypothetical protein